MSVYKMTNALVKTVSYFVYKSNKEDKMSIRYIFHGGTRNKKL